MQINITARDFGGTEFLAQPHRLHLGAQKAEGVDRLEFSLPEQWKGCVVTLHIRHADGTLAEPAGAGRNRLRQRGPEFYWLGQR